MSFPNWAQQDLSQLRDLCHLFQSWELFLQPRTSGLHLEDIKCTKKHILVKIFIDDYLKEMEEIEIVSHEGWWWNYKKNFFFFFELVSSPVPARSKTFLNSQLLLGVRQISPPYILLMFCWEFLSCGQVLRDPTLLDRLNTVIIITTTREMWGQRMRIWWTRLQVKLSKYESLSQSNEGSISLYWGLHLGISH